MDVTEFLALESHQQQRHPWELARKDFVAALVRENSSLNNKKEQTEQAGQPRNPVFLDVGCGDGFISAHLATLYPKSQFYGVDLALTPELIETIKDKRGLPNMQLAVTLDDLAALKAPPADVIFLFDVIEHVEDETALLEELAHKHLAPGGVIFITVPAYNWLYTSHDAVLGHHRRYSLASLKQTCNNAGLKVEQDGCRFALPMLARICSALGERLKLTKPMQSTALSRWRHGALLTKLLHVVFLADFALARLLKRANFNLPGLTCFAICRKRS